MFIHAKQILNKPVFSKEEEEYIGKVLEIIVSPENYQLLGFLVSQSFSKPKIVSEIDVLELTPEGLLINSANSLLEIDEVLKIKEIFDRQLKIIGAKAETESQRQLGKVFDFVIETNINALVKFYIKGGLLSPVLILPPEKVVKIEKGKIIFSEDVLEKPNAAEAVGL